MTRQWQPILEGGLRDRALEAIDSIARTLIEPGSTVLGDLAGGSAGIAIFYAYLARTGVAPKGSFTAIPAHLDAAMEAAATQPLREGLFGGFTGIAWALEHVYALFDEDEDGDDGDDDSDDDGGFEKDDDSDDDDSDVNEEVDQALLSLLSKTPWPHDYDLVSGLVGLGVYALERMPLAVGRQMLAAVIHRLEELAEPSGRGITWHTRPELLPPHQRAVSPNGVYNLGVAHGVPGIIAFLGQALPMGVEQERVAALLERAVAWLLDQRMPPHTGSAFAWAHVPGTVPTPCRSAWCYGDPGVAAALLIAAEAADEAVWREAGRAISVQASRRSLADAGVMDVGLCHGSAGLAQVYCRLYEATGAPELRDAARHWYACTLDAWRPEGSAARFAPLGNRNEVGKGEVGKGEAGFLTGLAGVGLALLAGTSGTPPSWDRCLLLSRPPCYE